MQTLLVQGCSKTKNRVPGTIPAIELYSGYFFRIIKKSMRDDAFDENIDICILSAEYGLIDASTEIERYDRRMDPERAEELAPEVQATLENRAESYDTVIINVGKTYEIALGDVAERLDADVYHIDGGGIGEKGRALKKYIRTTESGATLRPVPEKVAGEV